MLELSVHEGLHSMERTHAGAALEELQPVGSTHTGEVCEGESPVGGTLCWSRGCARGERNSRDYCYELTVTLTPCSPAPLRREEADESGEKLFEEEGGGRKVFFSFILISH